MKYLFLDRTTFFEFRSRACIRTVKKGTREIFGSRSALECFFEQNQIILKACNVILKPSRVILKPSHVILKPSLVILKPSHVILKPSQFFLKPSQVILKPSQVILKVSRFFLPSFVAPVCGTACCKRVWFIIIPAVRLLAHRAYCTSSLSCCLL